MSSSASRLGPGGAPLTAGLLPPGVFDPKVDNSDWYTYQVDAGNSKPPSGNGANLAPGATASPWFIIERDVDFYLSEPRAFAIDTAGNVYSGTEIQATVQLYDSGTVRELFSAALPVGDVFGIAEVSPVMVLPRLFRSMSTLTFTVTNISSATTFAHLWLTFVGYRVYLGM
jgi:hypothetical protein